MQHCALYDPGMTAIGYVRVSTERQAASGLSIAAQRRKIEAQAVVNDYALVEASSIDCRRQCEDARTVRAGTQDHAAPSRAGQVDAIVIVAKLDRATRSVADLGRLLEDLGKARRADGGRGVALVSCAESLDTSTAGGRLVLNVLGAVAQWEREATAERTSAALQQKKAQGRRYCNVAPFGSAFIDGRRVDHAGEQLILTAGIIGHRRGGLSWAKVADQLNADGHRTRTGAPWTRQGAQQIHAAREREDQQRSSVKRHQGRAGAGMVGPYPLAL